MQLIDLQESPRRFCVQSAFVVPSKDKTLMNFYTHEFWLEANLIVTRDEVSGGGNWLEANTLFPDNILFAKHGKESRGFQPLRPYTPTTEHYVLGYY